MTIRYATGV